MPQKHALTTELFLPPYINNNVINKGGAGTAQWLAHGLFLGHLSTSAGSIPSHAQIFDPKKNPSVALQGPSPTVLSNKQNAN